MRSVAFATCAEHPGLVDDDRLAVEALRARGVAVTPLVWDAASGDGTRCPVVIRSCWDYHLRPDDFMAWARQVERDRALWNPAQVIEWNRDKRYLRAFAAQGVAIPACVWAERGEQRSLSTLVGESGWSRAVVKPLVSAGAWRTFVTGARVTEAAEVAWSELLCDSGALVQQFLPEVETAGEWSLIFFRGDFSHAVLKRPKHGDFRVQFHFGGTALVADPPASVLRAARRVLALVDAPLLFARVDGVLVDGSFLLMELELIEPALFLSADPAAPGRFAEAVAALCC